MAQVPQVALQAQYNSRQGSEQAYNQSYVTHPYAPSVGVSSVSSSGVGMMPGHVYPAAAAQVYGQQYTQPQYIVTHPPYVSTQPFAPPGAMYPVNASVAAQQVAQQQYIPSAVSTSTVGGTQAHQHHQHHQHQGSSKKSGNSKTMQAHQTGYKKVALPKGWYEATISKSKKIGKKKQGCCVIS